MLVAGPGEETRSVNLLLHLDLLHLDRILG